jgi:uncharacterized protein (DUF4415 family)
MSKTVKLKIQTRARATGKASVAMPSTAENRKILSAAKSDPDAQPLTPTQLKAMQPLHKLRGRPKSEASKQLLSVRYSPTVIDYFKSTGQGWQVRMDEVLSRYVNRQLKKTTT